MPGELPDVLFVGRKKKEQYCLVLFLIEETNEDGTPKRLTMIKNDDQEIEVKEGTMFMTGYVPRAMVERTAR